MKETARKGYARAADIPADVLSTLSRGEMASATLSESLAIDQRMLLGAVFPELTEAQWEELDTLCQLGILKRMMGVGAWPLQFGGRQAWERCRDHGSDTVRGWSRFMVGAEPDLSLAQRLEKMESLANDAHFGVREWAWMALRPHLAADLDRAVELLGAWSLSPSAYLRRFSCEALRPRGVWCAHIAVLKREPGRMLPILSALSADDSVYVQDSVANWLNDAAKDQADWVRSVCAQWQAQAAQDEATQRICRRALRSLTP
ncbi:DNA alkylation repair protein [Alcaligenes sp. Marseille-Q7550]